ncbi:hypothetical protein NEF87_004146 [Candidatus Lokiarchaeum ossiferum]|uniref:CN hydrolase domain-containing protein n=1 Tax=Candidatus Lokiarchaeum ossiferum TaxID=2951803 RepID=A0ABY6HWF3_9ARCH|nr:hypothetical protein NEF87_004146 [Candidatus Lokiarchaeum sp. B-35]
MKPPKEITISLIQPFVDQDNSKNFQKMEMLIGSAIKDGAKIICLPERWFFLDFSKGLNEYIQPIQGIQYQYVKKWSKMFQTSIISGGIWEHHENTKQSFVSSYYFKNGEEIFRQDKIHLYGAEKSILTPGSELVCFYDSEFDVTFCILICFDLHISSSLSSMAVKNNCEIIFSPTLIRNDGENNWKTYVQARSLENRIPIVSCNSIFNQLGRDFCGKSKIIHFNQGLSSPVTLVSEEASTSEEVLTRTINLEFCNKLRIDRMKDIVDPNSILVIK